MLTAASGLTFRDIFLHETGAWKGQRSCGPGELALNQWRERIQHLCQPLAPSKPRASTGKSFRQKSERRLPCTEGKHTHTHTHSSLSAIKVWRSAAGSKSDRWPSQSGLNIDDRDRTTTHTETKLEGREKKTKKHPLRRVKTTRMTSRQSSPLKDALGNTPRHFGSTSSSRLLQEEQSFYYISSSSTCFSYRFKTLQQGVFTTRTINMSNLIIAHFKGLYLSCFLYMYTLKLA